jgi:hypothetical protein
MVWEVNWSKVWKDLRDSVILAFELESEVRWDVDSGKEKSDARRV